MSAAAASCHHKILLSEDAIEYDSLEDRRETLISLKEIEVLGLCGRNQSTDAAVREPVPEWVCSSHEHKSVGTMNRPESSNSGDAKNHSSAMSLLSCLLPQQVFIAQIKAHLTGLRQLCMRNRL